MTPMSQLTCQIPSFIDYLKKIKKKTQGHGNKFKLLFNFNVFDLNCQMVINPPFGYKLPLWLEDTTCLGVDLRLPILICYLR